MSADRVALQALATRTKAELRYFELVTVHIAGNAQQCFLCVGLHAIYMVRRNLSALYPTKVAGEIFYAHIDKVVEDSLGVRDLVLLLGVNRSTEWLSGHILFTCEHRERLVNYLRVAWRTDSLWRMGISKALPCHTQPLPSKETQAAGLQVPPIAGSSVVLFGGYSFHVPDGYTAPINTLVARGVRTLIDSDRNLDLTIDVREPVTLQELVSTDRDHVRWSAGDHRRQVTEGLKHVTIHRNGSYIKRANLASDLAKWTAWELHLRCDGRTDAIVILRRQYVPPLMDTAQHIIITISTNTVAADGEASPRDSPRDALDMTEAGRDALLEEARCIGDSVAPLVHDCTVYQTVYREMVQAKLDTLMYHEEATKWLHSSLSLKPALEPDAKEFLRCLFKILQDENALNVADLVRSLRGPAEESHVVELPMVCVERIVQKKTPGRAFLLADSVESMNAWRSRLARYLASSVDGGLLAHQFCMRDLARAYVEVTAEGKKLIAEVLLFLLHIRPKDFSRPFVGTSVTELLDHPHFEDLDFNESVMQALVEAGWVAKQLQRPGHSSSSYMSDECARFLAQLLRTRGVGKSLKATVCREILKIKSAEAQVHFLVLIPALVESLKVEETVYLKSYITATLVNISGGHDVAKSLLVSLDVLPTCAEHLKLNDDDLTQYSLALVTNLSKTVLQRAMITDCGFIQVLIDLLDHTYDSDCKEGIHTELTSIIGQLCNDEDIWKEVCEPEWNVRDNLLHIFKRSKPGSKLRSKTTFALKQLCGHAIAHENKRILSNESNEVVEYLKDDLNDFMTLQTPNAQDLDLAANAVLLLLALSGCEEGNALMYRVGIRAIVAKLSKTTLLGRLDSTRGRLEQLGARLAVAEAEAAFLPPATAGAPPTPRSVASSPSSISPQPP